MYSTVFLSPPFLPLLSLLFLPLLSPPFFPFLSSPFLSLLPFSLSLSSLLSLLSLLPFSLSSLLPFSLSLSSLLSLLSLLPFSSQGTIETSISDQSVLLLCGDEDERSLLERLKIRRGEEIDPVPSRLLRKYIGYARKYVHPHLSIEAADVLQVRTGSLVPNKLGMRSGYEAR